MPVKKFLQHAFVLIYLTITLSAFLFTMTKKEVFPFIPWRVTRYAYGMMAPYQGYSEYNVDLLAEGKRNEPGLVLRLRPASQGSAQDDMGSNETWEVIDLDPYYPMMHRGSAIMYKRLRSFLVDGEDIHKQKYDELASLILKQERARGRAYEAVRLTWEEWPRSPEGFDAMRREENITEYFITEITE